MNREDQFNFAAFFNARLKERGLSLKKLSELSGIAMQDLQNLSEGDFEKLPPAPYLRGYTTRLAKILEFDPDIWWQHFEAIGAVKAAGVLDRLPQNRFAISKIGRYRWLIAIVVLVGLYGGLRFSKILGRPIITIDEPSGNPAYVQEHSIIMYGALKGGDHIYINNESVPVEQGAWQSPLSLEPGQNTVTIRATKFLGKETIVTKDIVYEPPTEAASSTNGASTSPETAP